MKKVKKKDILKNSNEKPFKIISLKNEGNYIKRKNAIRYNSSQLKVIIDNYKKIIFWYKKGKRNLLWKQFNLI